MDSQQQQEGTVKASARADPEEGVYRQVEEGLAALRPAMEADGGGVELVSVQDGVICIRLRGTCLACPSASLTLKLGIERTLIERMAWIKKVIRVGWEGSRSSLRNDGNLLKQPYCGTSQRES